MSQEDAKGGKRSHKETKRVKIRLDQINFTQDNQGEAEGNQGELRGIKVSQDESRWVKMSQGQSK